MPLLLAQQPAYDTLALAKITAQSIAFADQQADQYIQRVEQERKLNLDQATKSAELRSKQQIAGYNRNLAERRLALANTVESRQQELADERLKALRRNDLLATGVQQFRNTAYGGGSPGVSPSPTSRAPYGSEPDLPEQGTPDQLGQNDLLPAPPGQPDGAVVKSDDPRVRLEADMNMVQEQHDQAIAAGDVQTARILNSRLQNLQRLYYNPNQSDEAIQNRELKNRGVELDNRYKEETIDSRIETAQSRADTAGAQANVATSTEEDRIAKAAADTRVAEARVKEIQARTNRGANPAITPSAEASIRNNIGKLQADLAKDSAAQVTRERILKGKVGQVPEESRDLVIGALESSGTLPKVMSAGERQVAEQRIQALQATLDGGSTTGSQSSAQEQQAPTQEAAGSGTGDGQEATLDSLLR